jgi:hypothetical protein
VLWWQKKKSHENTKTQKLTKAFFVRPFGAIFCLRALVAKKIATKTPKHENSRKPSLQDLMLQHRVVTEIFGKINYFILTLYHAASGGFPGIFHILHGFGEL